MQLVFHLAIWMILILNPYEGMILSSLSKPLFLPRYKIDTDSTSEHYGIVEPFIEASWDTKLTQHFSIQTLISLQSFRSLQPG